MIRTFETSNGWAVGVGPLADHAMGRCLRGQRPAAVPLVPWKPATPQATPLDVLCWRSRSLPLTGRDGDKQALLEWAHSGPGARARILVGDPGSGKTRLAAEVADTLQQEGWSAGFVHWSDGRVWRVGRAGALLVLDDPFDAEGRCRAEVEAAIRDTVIGTDTLRLLVLSRDRGRSHLPPPGIPGTDEAVGDCSLQNLDHLSLEDAATIHHEALRRYAPERPVPRPDQSFAEWAGSDPEVRLRPLYAIAAAMSLGHPPWDQGYPADSRRTIVGLAQATHNQINDEGDQAGLAAGAAPFVVAVAEVRGGLNEADLQALAAKTALTRSDVERFVDSVKRLAAWSAGRLEPRGDSLPQAEFVRMEYCDALERGLGLRIGAAMHTAHRRQVAQLDRNLSDAGVSVDQCDRLARVISLDDDRWLRWLDVAPRADSLIGRLAHHAAVRAAPNRRPNRPAT